MKPLLSLSILILIVSKLPGAVVVLHNATAAPIECTVTVGSSAPAKLTIAVGEARPIECGRTVSVSFLRGTEARSLSLEPWMAYLFITKKQIGTDLIAIALEGKSPGIADVPETLPVRKPLKIPVKLVVDDADRRAKAIWTDVLSKRLSAASAVMTETANVAFEVLDTDEWTLGPAVADLRGFVADAEKTVKPDPATLAIVYSSRPFGPVSPTNPTPLLAINRPALNSLLLIRESEPKSEPERVELLASQLGRFLGAVTSPDPISAMRPKLGDGKAMLVKFRIGFDPLNSLAINIWVDGLRSGKVRGIGDLSPEMQLRLARVYATIFAAQPDEPMSEEIATLLDRAGFRVAVAPPPPEAKRDPKNPAEVPRKADRALTPEQDAIRKVVKAVVIVADDNARKPAALRLKGDDLTNQYIKAAADVAFDLEPKYRKAAFLYGIGIGLDDSTVLRDKPILGDLLKAVEPDDDRKARLAVLGNPTIRYRRDLCQHFVISAALTEFGGAMIAEQVGLAKEKLDMAKPTGSGFSFSDLAADLAGIELATAVTARGDTLDTIRQSFRTTDYVPTIDDLPDGLSKEKFKSAYGDTSDPRFNTQYDSLKKRVKSLAVYQK
jgi:hypothetical protein